MAGSPYMHIKQTLNIPVKTSGRKKSRYLFLVADFFKQSKDSVLVEIKTIRQKSTLLVVLMRNS